MANETGLSEEQIQSIVSKSDNPEFVTEVISNHFNGLDRPCSVSIGVKSFYDEESNDQGIKSPEKLLDSDILQVVNLLREKGIDAVPYNSPEAADISKFVVDRSGISTPMLNKEDALQATADIADILKNSGNDIKGFAFPQTAESLTYYNNEYKQGVDVIENNTNSAVAEQIQQTYGMSVSEFINQQTEILQSMPEVDIAAKQAQEDYTTGFRGGSFGSQAHAVLSARRSKDLAYITPHLDVAQKYCFGAGYSTQIGIIAEVEMSSDQKFFGDFGLETRGNTSSKEYAYESIGLSHKNPVKAMYMVKEGKMYQIADENGYISKEMELFAKLHDVKALAGNEIMYQRGNTLKKTVETDINQATQTYDTSKKLDAYKPNTYASAQDYIERNYLMTDAKQENGKFSLDKVVSFGQQESDVKQNIDGIVPPCIADIQFKKVVVSNGLVEDNPILKNISNLTLSACSVENGKDIPDGVVFQNCNFADNLDLSHLKNAKFIGCSFPDNIKLPQQIEFNDCQLSPNMDLSNRNISITATKDTLIDDILKTNIGKSESVKISGTFHAEDITLLDQLHTYDISNLKTINVANKETFDKIDTSLPCSCIEDKTAYLRNVKIDSLQDIGAESLYNINTLKFQGDCHLGDDISSDLFRRVSRNKKLDFSQCTSLEIEPATEAIKIANIEKYNIPETTKIKCAGVIGVENAEDLKLLEKYDISKLKCIEVKSDAETFFNEVKQAGMKLPQDIGLMFDDNGSLSHVVTERSKEHFNKVYGGKVIGTVEYSPEQFTQRTGIEFGKIEKTTQEKAENSKAESAQATPSKEDKDRLAELSGRTGDTKPVTQTQDGKAEIKPDAELKFENPIQTSDLPSTPVVVQAPSQDEYDKFVAKDADSKLRKVCEDLRTKDEKLYTQVVTEWNQQYSANPPKDMEQGNQIAQNVMMQYKKDLEPHMAEDIQKNARYDELISENTDSKLRNMCANIEKNDPALFQQLTEDWRQHYAAAGVTNVAQADEVAKKIMIKYKKQLIPHAQQVYPQEMSQKTPLKTAQKQEKTATTPDKDSKDSKNDKARIAELSGRTGQAKPAAKAKEDTPTQTQDGKAEIKPGAELKFATPMQTSDLPPSPVVVQAPSQDEYDKFAAKDADSKLRKVCEDLRGKDEKLYTQVVTEWNRQYSANPPKDMAQGDQIAQNVMMQYKKDLEPLVIDQIQKDITPQNTANVDTTKLEQAKVDLQQKDPTVRAEAVAELNKQAEAAIPQQQNAENATGPTAQPQTAFKEQSNQQQGAEINYMRTKGRNRMLEQSADYIPNPITAPTRTAPQHQQTISTSFNPKTLDTGRGA